MPIAGYIANYST